MTTKKKPTTWEVLSDIDCTEHAEKKGDLSYLSWAWAWGILKKHYPDASFEKHWFTYGDGYSIPYALDKQGSAFVKVTVTVAGVDVTEVMPVLDHRNRSVQKPDSFQVNTSLQRCLTKAIAFHGLGHYIYAGEDLPDVAEEVVEEEVVDETPAAEDTSASAPVAEAGMSVSEWRKAFVTTKTAAETDEGVIVAEGKNLAGWQQVVTAFEVFMPSVEDVWGDGKKKHADSEACVKQIEDWYRLNKQTIKALGEDQPELLKGLVKIFSAAKKAAKDNKPFDRKGVSENA